MTGSPEGRAAAESPEGRVEAEVSAICRFVDGSFFLDLW